MAENLYPMFRKHILLLPQEYTCAFSLPGYYTNRLAVMRLALETVAEDPNVTAIIEIHEGYRGGILTGNYFQLLQPTYLHV